jgi:hypothetical protein
MSRLARLLCEIEPQAATPDKNLTSKNMLSGGALDEEVLFGDASGLPECNMRSESGIKLQS